VDPWFIKEVDPEHSRLIVAARAINDDMPRRVAGKIRRAVAEIPAPKIVAVGATYKPNTNDVRGSPANTIVQLLRDDGYEVAQFDPLVPELGYGSLADVCEGADCLVVLVPHEVVQHDLALHEDEIRRRMRRPLILQF
jgi:UDP-N-acetyl-D-mannosaminuronic acid dehydrogenase